MDSGLCPHCFNGCKPLSVPEPVTEVPAAVALAGVLDDPQIEGQTSWRVLDPSGLEVHEAASFAAHGPLPDSPR